MKITTLKTALPLLFLAAGSLAQAQTSDPHGYLQEHGVSISVGATSPFDRQLNTNASPQAGFPIPTPTGGTIYTTVTAQQQYTTNSLGFVSSLAFHPKPWAGIELNYGFSHLSERYSFDYSAASIPQTLSITTDVHEFTGAYQFHPKHIPFQPFVNIGGGALDFDPRANASYQFRGAGLLEAGFDLPTHNRHIGFRIEGRSLFYRQPNFYVPATSTRGWGVTFEPSISTYYRF